MTKFNVNENVSVHVHMQRRPQKMTVLILGCTNSAHRREREKNNANYCVSKAITHHPKIGYASSLWYLPLIGLF